MPKTTRKTNAHFVFQIMFQAAGYGRTVGNDPSPSPVLKEADVVVKVKSLNKKSHKKYKKYFPLQSSCLPNVCTSGQSFNLMCLGEVSGRTCAADSGGFVVNRLGSGGTQWVQHGVTSFGIEVSVNATQQPAFFPHTIVSIVQ